MRIYKILLLLTGLTLLFGPLPWYTYLLVIAVLFLLEETDPYVER
jgi:hypothetical protein